MRNIIFHYPIFKNAGTSIDELLNLNFPNRLASKEFAPDYALNQKQVALWCQKRINVKVFSSHTALLPPPSLPDTQVFPVLFIRHPIDRIASAYHFEKKQKGDSFSIQLARNHSFADYINDHLQHEGIGQCRNLQSHRLAQWFHGAPGEMGHLALQALENLPFVGLVEAFDESIEKMADWLRPHFPNFKPTPASKNVGRAFASLEQKLTEIRAEIGDDCFQRLLAANAADMAVYEAVKTRYAKKSVPKSIMQYWHSPELPEDIAGWIGLWKQRNPDFQHHLFNDDSARSYLSQHFPKEYVESFNDCALPAMRCDFFRYAYIYNEGGVYVDAAISCHSPLSEWLDLNADMILLKKEKWDGRPTNSFIVAKARHPFLKRVLEDCVNNIQNKVSNNVWLVTGPGVIKTLLDSNETSEKPELMSFRFFKTHAPPHQNASHKKTEHWSKIQHQQSIFNSGETRPRPPKLKAKPVPKEHGPQTHIKLALIGHPRCGSKSLAKYLTKSGLLTGHERLGEEGICSWWLTSRHKPEAHGFLYQGKGNKTLVVPELVCQFIRNPIDAIPSILIENEFNQRDNNSFKQRREVIHRLFGEDLAEHDPLAAATLSYVYWNKLAEQAVPDLVVKVEDMADDLVPVIEYFGLSASARIPKLNTSAKKFNITEKTAVDSRTLLAKVGGKTRLYLQSYLALYDGR